jgi:beta,beta-carotene 9',10'-dioxygenase
MQGEKCKINTIREGNPCLNTLERKNIMTGQFYTGFTTLNQEIVRDSLPVRGTLPSWLSGMLLRTGPAQFEVGQHQYHHWFDGLAMLHRFSFHHGTVSYANHFLHSRTYQENKEEGKITYGEFATDPCRSLFKRLVTTFTREVSDNANVNISQLGEEFVALTEVPLPVMFDAQTLETLGVFDFDDKIAGQVTTAHPHYDPHLHAGINYLAHLSAKSAYHVYAINAGDHQRQLLGSIPTEEPAYMHSFGMTEHYVILAEYPLMVKPLSMLLSGKPFIENYHWKPERGTHFLLLDKQDGSLVGRYKSEPFFSFHHVNAFERDDEVIVDLSAYPDPTIIQDFYLENLIGPKSRVISDGQLRRYRIPLSGTISGYDVLSEEAFDLPKINYVHSNGHDYRFAYGVSRRKETPDDFQNQLVKVDMQTKETRCWFEEDCYPGEAIFVATPNATREDDGILLSVVLDGKKGTSFLLVLDATSFREIARAEVPHHIPFSFHGMYTAS